MAVAPASNHLAASVLLGLVLFLTSGSLPAGPPDFLVDAEWLATHRNDPGLVILDVRYHPHRYFTVGHIPGAVQVQRFKDLGDNAGSPLMRFPAREAFQETLRRWGVDDDSTVVVYDDSRTALASRVYFLLDLYGFDMARVKLLDGGLVEWTAFEELAKDPVEPRPGKVTLKPANPALFVEWPAVYEQVIARRDPAVALLDARPRDHYTGETIRHSVQGGHIPGAVNVVSLDGTDAQSQKWLGAPELAALYRAIPADRTVLIYCHDSFRSTLAYTQLRSLGYRDVRVYNGGWAHWGNTLTLPVVQGDAPYDEEFSL